MQARLKMRLRRPGIVSGSFVAAALTAALVGICFCGWRVAGLPFVPFDTFDRLTRVLPGRLNALGIGIMVSVIRALRLGPTSAIAKTAEQAMAIALAFVTGVVGGVVLFLILRAIRGRNGRLLGVTLGVALGIPAMLISLHASGTTSVGPAAGAIWVLGAFLAWGAILGCAEQRLLEFQKPQGTAADTAVE